MLPSFGAKSVLLVDDEPLFTESLADALKAKYRYINVHEARDGLEALDCIREYKVNGIVTDVRMPRMRGLELIRRLQSIGRYIPCVMLTAHGTVDIATQSRQQGVVAYLEKPVDLPTLVDIAGWMLDQPEADHISGVTLNGFLQLLAMERSSCTVRVVGPKGHAQLGFSAGHLHFARCGPLVGDEAVLTTAAWEDYSIYLESMPSAEDANVESPVIELLLEAVRRGDEAKKARGSSIPTRSSIPPSSRRRGEWTAPVDVPEHVAPAERKERPGRGDRSETNMSNVDEVLDKAMDIGGAFAVALVDYESGMSLGTRCTSSAFNIEVAASGNTQVVRSKMSVMDNLGIQGAIEDILISLDTQYHLIRPLSGLGNLFLYLAIDRKKGNLGLARHQLNGLEKELSL